MGILFKANSDYPKKFHCPEGLEEYAEETKDALSYKLLAKICFARAIYCDPTVQKYKDNLRQVEQEITKLTRGTTAH
jgi:hypothetical protein